MDQADPYTIQLLMSLFYNYSLSIERLRVQAETKSSEAQQLRERLQAFETEITNLSASQVMQAGIIDRHRSVICSLEQELAHQQQHGSPINYHSLQPMEPTARPRTPYPFVPPYIDIAAENKIHGNNNNSSNNNNNNNTQRTKKRGTPKLDFEESHKRQRTLDSPQQHYVPNTVLRHDGDGLLNGEEQAYIPEL